MRRRKDSFMVSSKLQNHEMQFLNNSEKSFKFHEQTIFQIIEITAFKAHKTFIISIKVFLIKTYY